MINEILATFPAYTILRPKLYVAPCDPRELPELTSGIAFRIPFQTKNHGIMWHGFIPGSVVSSCIEHRICPVRGIDRARERGRDLHWINAEPVEVTAKIRPHEYVEGLNFGDLVRFEGRVFRLDPAPNSNVALADVG
mgnify:CR=1 FL=1